MTTATYALPNPFIELADQLAASTEQAPLELERTDHLPEAWHLWDEQECAALATALAARRPLLVRGEAGSGKSQLARAAAKLLQSGPPLMEVIHPRFEALDLLYRFDLVKRLADAQIKKLAKTNHPYVQRGCLWQAFNHIQPGKQPPVLLIDEIDKADADVPNALLDVLGNRAFTVAPLNNRVVSAPEGRLPLIIITTNEERELPPAFVRRCVVLNLNPPCDQENDGQAFTDWLQQRGRAHQHLTLAAEVYPLAAAQVLADRRESRKEGYPPVGLAEYIDLLNTLHELTRNLPAEAQKTRQLSLLDRLGRYILIKNANQNQRRPALEQPA